MKMQRKSNFELMRVILTIMIITLHYLGNTGALKENVVTNNLNYYISHFIESLCIIAVNCFIITTGYFMHDKKKINIRKIIDLIAIATVYNILFFILTIILGFEPLTIGLIKRVIKLQFNFLGWFVPIYCILYLLIPYLNKLIANITKKEYKILIIILLLCFSIYPLLTNVALKDYGYGIITFITLYFVGAYLNKYIDSKNITKRKSFIIYLICTVITFVFSLFSDKAYHYYWIFNIISAASFVMFFSKINITSKIVNNLAKYTLGIYLVHNNSWVNNIIWDFFGKNYHSTNYFILHLIITVIIIYLVSLLIEIIRKLIFDKTLYKLFDKIKILNKEIEVE